MRSERVKLDCSAPLPEQHLDAAEFARTRLGFQPDPRQEELLRRPIRRALLNCSRQWGKSTLTAAKAVHLAYTKPESLSLVVSPSARQSAEFLRKASVFLRKLGIRPRGDGDNDISAVLPNGSRIVGMPGVDGTSRGFSAVSLLIIDEAARVQDDVYLSMRPVVAVGGGDVWLMSTPYGKRGFFWEEWSKHADRWERIRVPATDCPRIPPEFLEEERATMGERWFRQEYMCEFSEPDDAVFDVALIERALRADVLPLKLK